MPDPIRAAIVDDEPIARRSIRILLDADPDIEVVGEGGDGPAAVRLLRDVPIDLLFLDVQMPGMSGFDVLRALESEALPMIIFVTAHDQYAIRAFDSAALDYLLKPFDDRRFAAALERAKRRLRQVGDSRLLRGIAELLETSGSGTGEDAKVPAPPDRRYLERLMVREDGRVLVLPADRIDWLEAADYYVRIHLGRQTHLVRESLGRLETKLDPERFVRIHRSTMVNLERVRELQPWFQGACVVILTDGTRLKLSRARKERVEARLQGLRVRG
jgi:two-component system, LytTR family, response regulator